MRKRLARLFNLKPLKRKALERTLLSLHTLPSSHHLDALPSGGLQDAVAVIGEQARWEGTPEEEPSSGARSAADHHTLRLPLKATATRAAQTEEAPSGGTEFLYVTRLSRERWTWYRDIGRL